MGDKIPLACLIYTCARCEKERMLFVKMFKGDKPRSWDDIIKISPDSIECFDCGGLAYYMKGFRI